MASPNTAGVAAEVLSKNPGLSPLELKARLMETVSPVSTFRGRMISGGRVDLKTALKL